ncbi:hypothetical protein Sste5346_009984 [Sporothrix stenoceras]|uniref:Ankyrin repeat protein n=1 Tax=Sporothrix stenoceras TaxID=5173 RepID=A0ABR3YK49_9PEZI
MSDYDTGDYTTDDDDYTPPPLIPRDPVNYRPYTEYRGGGQILGEAMHGNNPVVLGVLLDYRNEVLKKAGLSPSTTPLPGTPFEDACRAAAVDTLRYLLEERPDCFDVSSHINKVEEWHGLTPLLTVAACAHDNARYNPDALKGWSRPGHGADPKAAKTKLDNAWDSQRTQFPTNSYPGGHGNALVLALGRYEMLQAVPFSDSIMDLLSLLLETESGVDVHQGAILATARVDGRGFAGLTDNDPVPGSNNVEILDCGSKRRQAGLEYWRGELAYLTPLAVAALNHNVPGIKALLALAKDGKADFTQDLVDPVMTIPGVDNDNLDDNVLFRDIIPMKPLHAACLGHATMQICAATINSFHRGYTPLHFAARFDRIHMVKALLERGADPSIRMPSVGFGRNSVFYHVFVYSLPRLSTRKYYPYHTTLVQMIDHDIQMYPLIKILLKQPDEKDPEVARRYALALVNEADEDGNTALHWAMGFGLPSTAAALKAHGAKPDMKNKAGEVPRRNTFPTTTIKRAKELIHFALDKPYKRQEELLEINIHLYVDKKES